RRSAVAVIAWPSPSRVQCCWRQRLLAHCGVRHPRTHATGVSSPLWPLAGWCEEAKMGRLGGCTSHVRLQRRGQVLAAYMSSIWGWSVLYNQVLVKTPGENG